MPYQDDLILKLFEVTGLRLLNISQTSSAKTLSRKSFRITSWKKISKQGKSVVDDSLLAFKSINSLSLDSLTEEERREFKCCVALVRSVFKPKGWRTKYFNNELRELTSPDSPNASCRVIQSDSDRLVIEDSQVLTPGSGLLLFTLSHF
jgi:hypothetical protein